MLNKKGLMIGLLILSSFSLVGCDLSKSKDTLSLGKERIKEVDKWFANGLFISDGDNDVLLTTTNAFQNNKKVVAPPKGSVFHLYEDLAGNSHDSFLPFTSSEAETYFLMSSSKYLLMNQKTDNYQEILNNSIAVADRLVDKSFTSCDSKENELVLINRTTSYDFDNKKWVENKEEVFIEDLLTGIIGLSNMYFITQDSDYLNTAKSFADTIITLQNSFGNNMSLPYRISDYNSENVYYPLYNIYPLYYTNLMKEAFTTLYDITKEDYLISSSANYIRFVETKLNDFKLKNKNSLLPLGIKNNNTPIYLKDEIWTEEIFFDTEKGLDMILGLSKPNNYFDDMFFDRNPITMSFIDRKYLNEFKQSGITDLPNHSQKSHLLKFALLQNDKELSLDILNDLLYNQISSSNNVSNSTWKNTYYVDFKETNLIINNLLDAYYELKMPIF